jgi:hypothetical protein
MFHPIGNNNNVAENHFSIVYTILIVIIAVYFCPWFYSSPKAKACDMIIAENRDFNIYYGIIGLRNHFTTPAADECDSSIIFRPALP